jgi:hypothetical protein
MPLSRLLDTSPHGTVLEPLGSHGSCHSKRADALSPTTEQFLLLPALPVCVFLGGALFAFALNIIVRLGMQ